MQKKDKNKQGNLNLIKWILNYCVASLSLTFLIWLFERR